MLFKRTKDKEVSQIENQDNSIIKVEKNEIEVIEVRDIKQYLANEYDYVHKLENEVLHLKEELELSEETKIKYEASLVTLEEFDNRIHSRDNEIIELNKKIALLKEEKKKEIDEKNTLKIKLNNLGRSREEIEERLNSEYEEYCKERINFRLSIIRNTFMNKKGTLTKSYVNEIIDKQKEE